MQKNLEAVYLPTMQVDCKYKEICSGCHSLGIPLERQQAAKAQHLGELLKLAQIPLNGAIPVVSPGAGHLRDRADWVFERSGSHSNLGLYGKNSRTIVDLEECQQLSPALQAWLEEVRNYEWNIEKGSLRLRVGPQNQKGLWLDFANLDVKKLLEEKSQLQKLQAQAFVEIGQRRKVPHFVDGVYKLKDADPQIWFQTWIEGLPVDLFCSVGSFTQPSLKANRDLVEILESWFNTIDANNILEFGSGIGNLSFPALGKSRFLTACEIDEGALKGFALSLQRLAQTVPEFRNCQERVRLLRGDFQNKNPQDFEKYDVVLANPPQSAPIWIEKVFTAFD